MAENLMLSRMIINITPNSLMNKSSCLNDINMNLVFDSLQSKFPGFTILICAQNSTAFIGSIYCYFQKTNNLIMVICYRSHWVVAANINTGRSTSSISESSLLEF